MKCGLQWPAKCMCSAGLTCPQEPGLSVPDRQATKDWSFSAPCIFAQNVALLSFTASLTAKCISRRPNCTDTFQCHSNNEHAIPRDRSSDKLGRGSRSSGCLAVVVVVLLFAHLGRWWCEEEPDGGDFLCFGRELPPRARPDRRPDLRGGSCCAAGLRSLRFHIPLR